jgi:hypothetical protein
MEMNKIILSFIFISLILIKNTSFWFFPEYEEEIIKKWKEIIERNEKIKIENDEKLLIKVNEFKEKNKIKNKKDKLILEELKMILEREPVAINDPGMIEYNWLNKENQTSILSISTMISHYNRNNAVNYAKKWAIWRNPDYNFYDWLNDCTNFTSQVIERWWLAYLINWVFWKRDKKNWYYVNTNWEVPSWTWWWAHNFYNHAKYYSNKYSSASYFWELQIWDLIQVDWTKDWTIDHSMVVTEKTWNLTSQIKVSYHSNDELDKKLSDLIIAYPNSNYYWWKIIY